MLKRILNIQYYSENSFTFNRSLFQCSKNTFLEGYFQSEKYFKNYEDILRNDFKIKKTIQKSNLVLLKKIDAASSVSVHVRRGDYVSDLDTRNHHGALGFDYYSTSIKLIDKKITDPVFFIFSDEPQLVEKNLSFPFPFTIISGNINEFCYEDLLLMSRCRHHIIANSSFSWWGAWLDARPNKIVIAPKKWFANLDQAL